MPFLDPKLELYVDGSLYYLNSNCYGLFNNHSEWSSGGFTYRLKQSTQAVELIALTKACQLAKEMTDSRYAFGVCHATGQ